MIQRVSLIALTISFGVVAACSSTSKGAGLPLDGGPGTGTNADAQAGTQPGVGDAGPATADPVKACEDTVEAIARAAERCGESYEQAHRDALNGAAQGDCSTVGSIRDERALRVTCFAFLRTVTCEELAASKIDPSCSGQLIPRTVGFQPVLVPASLFAGEP